MVIVDRTARAMPAFFDWSWAFVLEQITPQTTRLIVRACGTYKPAALGILAPLVLEPLHFVMERGMLPGIKRRAERPGT